MKQLLLTLLFLSCTPLFSQTLEGYILDSITQEKLPYANISLTHKNIGTSTDANGYFTLPLNNVEKHEWVLFSFIGYTSKSVPLNTLLEHPSALNIQLVPTNETLDEVVVTDNKIKYSNIAEAVGPKHKKTTFKSSVPYGYEVAAFIANDKRKAGKLSEVQLKFKKRTSEEMTVQKAYFRVSFFEVDKNGFPGDYLSSQNIILQPKGTETLKVDVEAYKIRFPENGIFVAVETINPTNVPPKSSMYITSPNLLYTHTEEKLLFTRYRGKNWTPQKSTSTFKQHMHKAPYIKLKVHYKK